MRLSMTRHLQALGRSVPPAATIGISVIIASVILSTTAIRSNAKADVATDKAVTIAGSLSQLCHAGNDLASLLQTARTTDGKPLCPTAEEIKINPTAAPVQLVSDDHIINLIRTELARRPEPQSAPPTMSQVTDAVQAVMRTNPLLFKGEKGDPGAAPSTSEIAQVVAAYFRSNQEQFRGPAGKNGVDGKNGTDGKDGADGRDGSDGSPGSDSPPATVTETATPDPTHNPEPDPVTDSPTETQQQRTQSTQRQQRQRGGLGGLLGN